MRATTIHAPYDMRVEDVPEPLVQLPTDAVVRVLRALHLRQRPVGLPW